MREGKEEVIVYRTGCVCVLARLLPWRRRRREEEEKDDDDDGHPSSLSDRLLDFLPRFGIRQILRHLSYIHRQTLQNCSKLPLKFARWRNSPG